MSGKSNSEQQQMKQHLKTHVISHALMVVICVKFGKCITNAQMWTDLKAKYTAVNMKAVNSTLSSLHYFLRKSVYVAFQLHPEKDRHSLIFMQQQRW